MCAPIRPYAFFGLFLLPSAAFGIWVWARSVALYLLSVVIPTYTERWLLIMHC